MLSTGPLLHLVFADANDTYYCNELLVLNFHQYLWLKLHEQGFACVYFLSKLKDDLFSVSTFGDTLSKPMRAKKISGLFSRQPSQKDSWAWFADRLKDDVNKRAALVCSMEDFCCLFGSKKFGDFLEDHLKPHEQTGSIVLTASPEAEATKKLLLEEDALENVDLPGLAVIRGDEPCIMYQVLKNRMGEAMVYLNTFTTERLRCTLTRFMMEDEKRSGELSLREHMAEYLVQWMNNPEFRSNEQRRGVTLLNPNISYNTLYNQLKDAKIWTTLIGRAQALAECGGIQAYAANSGGCGCVEDPVDLVSVRRNKKTIAGECEKLSLGRRFDLTDPMFSQIMEALSKLKKSARSPKNLAENAEIQGFLEKFTHRFNALCSAEKPDTMLVLRCLEAMCLFADKVYIPADSAQMQDVRNSAELYNLWMDGYQDVSNTLNWVAEQWDLPKQKNTADLADYFRRMLDKLDQAQNIDLSLAPARIKAREAIDAWNQMSEILLTLEQIESNLVSSGLNSSEQEVLANMLSKQKEINKQYRSQPGKERYLISQSDFF